MNNIFAPVDNLEKSTINFFAPDGTELIKLKEGCFFGNEKWLKTKMKFTNVLVSGLIKSNSDNQPKDS